jgi:hypothetical protein
MRVVTEHIAVAAFLTFSLIAFPGSAQAQSFEDLNTCQTTTDDPCLRTGTCSIQGSTWYQEVTVDRADLFDTMGWPGLCDQVHVALVQGNCYPGGGQTNVTVYLSATSFATIDQITGPLVCEADPTGIADARPPSLDISSFPNPFSHTTQISYSIPEPSPRSSSSSLWMLLDLY